MTLKRFLILIALLVLPAQARDAAAAEGMPPAAVIEATPKPESVGPLISTKLRPPKKKGKRREQKETDGSEAPGRFEADTILKSPYHVNGQPLEVDPD